jgi:hypothetical protein
LPYIFIYLNFLFSCASKFLFFFVVFNLFFYLKNRETQTQTEGNVPNMGKKETQSAIEAAERAFPLWSKKTVKVSKKEEKDSILE